MANNEVTLRVITKAGRIRLQCDFGSSTLKMFREQVANKLKVEPASLVLTLDASGSKILRGEDRLMSYWSSIKDGSEIYGFVEGGVRPEIVTPRDLVGQRAKSLTPKRVNKRTKDDQNYKTFEDYLEETDFNVSLLPLSQSYAPVRRNLNGPTKLPPSISLKRQAYRHVDHIEVMSVSALNGFVQRWRDTDMLHQKAAYLIGYYLEDLHYGPNGLRAVVEAIYEPAAQSESAHYSPESFMNPTSLDEMAARVAHGLGFEIVGWVFTHLGRKTLITAAELLRMARLQLRYLHQDQHYTGYPISTFVTLTISPKESLKGQPGTDAFSVTDLGLALVRDHVLDETRALELGQDLNSDRDSDAFIYIRDSKDRNELMPGVLESTREVNKLDTDWLLVRLAESAPKEARLLLKRNTFPPANVSHVTFEDVGTFLADPNYARKLPYERLADFNFILFISQTLGYESAEQIITAVREKSDISQEFYTLMKSLA